jgi:hypothetical protein
MKEFLNASVDLVVARNFARMKPFNDPRGVQKEVGAIFGKGNFRVSGAFLRSLLAVGSSIAGHR